MDSYQMDADGEDITRDLLKRRQKRWSMNSQRLEEIVAELMKPISDVRRSFDTDLSALLEEYLTEAGLHALDAEVDDCEGVIAPNFAELALLLQQSACIYGRKVDFLYQHVLSVSDSLQTSSQDESQLDETLSSPSSRSHNRRKETNNGFSHISLECSSSANRKEISTAPPPTLPRLYLELEPRLLSDRDIPLMDYNGEAIGLMTDFQVTWPLQDGLLVDELETRSPHCGNRSAPLKELQEALLAQAPEPIGPFQAPTQAETHEDTLTDAHEDTPTQEEAKPQRRKRKGDFTLDDNYNVLPQKGRICMALSQEGVCKFSRNEEFSLPIAWLESVVRNRSKVITHFRIQDMDTETGFLGFNNKEAEDHLAVCLPRVLARLSSSVGLSIESDDDGFFEQSSLGDSDLSRVEDPSITTVEWSPPPASLVPSTLDVRQECRRLVEAAKMAAQADSDRVQFCKVLKHAEAQPHDVSRLFLATLFLANAGNVEIFPKKSLSLAGFELRVTSRPLAKNIGQDEELTTV